MISKKYILKDASGQIFGPFDISKLKELFIAGKILGDEKVAYFPGDDWKSLSEFSEIVSFLEKVIGNSDNGIVNKGREDKTIIKMFLDKGQFSEDAEKKEKKKVVEFNYKKNNNEIYEKLAEDVADGADADDDDDDGKQDIDKTVIVGRETTETALYREKTIVNTQQIAFPEEEKKEEQKVEKKKVAAIDQDKKTEIFNFKKNLGLIKKEAKQTENEESLYEKEKEDEIKLLEKKTNKPDESEEDENVKKRKIGIKPISALAVITIMLYLLFPDKDPNKPIEVIFPKITFPKIREFENASKALEIFQQGKVEYLKGGYKNKLNSIEFFKKSLGFKFSNNEAKSYLILVYAEVLDNLKDKSNAQLEIYKIVKHLQADLLIDINAALGASIFFTKVGRAKTAKNILENFSLVKKRLTLEFLSHYLNVLTKVKDFKNAQKTFQRLIDSSKGTQPVVKFIYGSRYLTFIEEDDKAYELVLLGLKLHPESVSLTLEMAGFQFERRDYKGLTKSLLVVKKHRAENSPIYKSKYLKYLGMLAVSKKSYHNAAILFKRALKLYEEDDLMSMLSSLEAGGGKIAQKLIVESKNRQLVKKSKKYARKKKWDLAFKYAIEASDIWEQDISTQLWLAELQTITGYYQSALETLEDLQVYHPNNLDISFLLIKAYISAGKMDEATQRITIISQRKRILKNYMFKSLLGRIYLKRNKTESALKALGESVAMNPLNDEDYFLLSKIFFKYRHYKSSKSMLAKAKKLDPDNVEYISLYAKILYDWNGGGADIAIGYLREELAKNSDSIRILSDIAILYYKSGQIQHYKHYKKRLLELSRKEVSLYKFLIESAKLDNDIDEIIKNAKEILKESPGDLDNQILLAEYLIIAKMYNDAREVLNGIKNRLPTFFKVNYLIGEIYYIHRDYKSSLEFGELEKKYYPNSYEGYLLAGKSFEAQARSLNSRKRRGEKLYKAIQNYEMALSKDPKKVDVLKRIAFIKYTQGLFNLAKAYYDRALEQDQANPEVNRQLGYVNIKIGQRKVALQYFKIYLNLYPNAPDRLRIDGLIKKLQ